MTLSFSEPVTGLALDDIEVVNGAKSALSGSKAEYLFVVTPNANFTGSVVVRLPGSAATNQPGKGNVAGEASFEVDTSGPSVAVSSADMFPVREAFEVTLSFSEPVTGLALDDIEVAPGNKTNLRGSVRDYTFTVNPPADFEGSVTVRVPQDAARDTVGNGNQAGSGTFRVDTRGPTPVSGTAVVNGGSVTVGFHESLGTVPAESAFKVLVAGESRTVTGTGVAGDRLELTISPAAGYGEAITEIGYTVPSMDPLLDALGNRAAAFSIRDASNESPAAVVSVAAVEDGEYIAGDTVQIDVRFDTSMDVHTTSGVPSLLLVVGPLSRFGSAQYKSGSGTSVLRFDYDVADGDVAPDLGYAGAAALALNGAEIAGCCGGVCRDAHVACAGSAGSLSGTSAVVLDGTKRRIFSIGPASAEAEEGEPLRFTISLDRAGQPWMGSVGYVTLAAPGDTAVAGVDYIASASQVSFGESDDAAMIEIKTLEDDIDEFDETFTVQLGKPSSGSSISGVADKAAATGRILDDDAAVVAGVSAADGLYIAGDVVSVDVTFTTAVAVDTSGGVPRLLLETGTTDRHAAYVSWHRHGHADVRLHGRGRRRVDRPAVRRNAGR